MKAQTIWSRRTSQGWQRGRASERLAAALAIQLGSLLMMLGTSWDIQWHGRVGRDSFWIPPHLVLYAGLALVGLTLFTLLLREQIAPAPRTRVLLGARATSGSAISAAGLGLMLLAAPFDDWWHRTFGIDVTVWSPPHLLLIAGGASIIIGAIVSHAALLALAAGGRADRRPALTGGQRRLAWLALAVGLGQLNGPLSLSIQPAMIKSFVASTAESPLLYPLLAAFALPPVLGAARAALDRRWGATLVAGSTLGLACLSMLFAQLAFWLMYPQGLPGLLPEIAQQFAIDSATFGRPGRAVVAQLLLPALLLLAALALDLAWPPDRAAGRSAGLAAALGAAAWSTTLLAGSLGIWLLEGRTPPLAQALALLAPMTLIATAGLWLGWRAGRALFADHV